MKIRTTTYLIAFVLFASCSLLDVFPEPEPEGPFPSSEPYDSVLVIVGREASSIKGRDTPSRSAHVFNPVFPPDSVDYVVKILASLDPNRESGDSLFVGASFSKGDTLTISTIVVDTTFHTDPNIIIDHIPEYNPEKKRWRIATHRVTRLHTINGVPVRE